MTGEHWTIVAHNRIWNLSFAISESQILQYLKTIICSKIRNMIWREKKIYLSCVFRWFIKKMSFMRRMSLWVVLIFTFQSVHIFYLCNKWIRKCIHLFLTVMRSFCTNYYGWIRTQFTASLSFEVLSAMRIYEQIKNIYY